MSKIIQSYEELLNFKEQFSEIISFIKSDRSVVKNYTVYKHRSLLLEWVLQLSYETNCKYKTYFQTIEIFDRIIEIMNFPEMDLDKMRVFAIVCLIMSIKLEEVNILSLGYALRVLNENSSSIDELKEIEICILFSLNFTIPKNHFEEFSFLILQIFFYENRLCHNYIIIHQACIDLYKNILKKYEFFRFKEIIPLFLAIIFLSLKKEFNFLFTEKTFEFYYSFKNLCSEYAEIDKIIEYSLDIQKEFL